MNRPSRAGYILTIAVALTAIILALRPTTAETEAHPPIRLPDPEAGSPAAVVIAMRESPGFSLFGLTFGEKERTVTVQFYAPAGCYEQLSTSDSWPVSFEQCSGTIVVDGIVSGGGIAATGESIVAVDVVVSNACFESINAGDTWPQPTCG